MHELEEVYFNISNCIHKEDRNEKNCFYFVMHRPIFQHICK